MRPSSAGACRRLSRPGPLPRSRGKKVLGLPLGAFVFSLVLGTATTLPAAPPELDSIFPAGAQRGTRIEITLGGKFDPWPCELHFPVEGISFEPDPEKAGAGTLELSEDLPLGPLLARAYNDEGASAPVLFVVGEHPEIRENNESASTVAKAPSLDGENLPLVVNGRLSAAHEMDGFRFTLGGGDILHAALEAYALRSPVDPVLKVYDAAGNRLLLQHNGPDNLDPRVAFTAPESGEYVVAVAGFAHPPATNIAFVGSARTLYRLHLAREVEGLPERLRPLDPGPEAPLEKAGSAEEGPEEAAAEPASLAEGAAAPASDDEASADEASDPLLRRIRPGHAVGATLSGPGEEHRYRISAQRGDALLVRVEARSLGHPVDPVLRIVRPGGADLRTVDDGTAPSLDPEFFWKVAEDGDFTLVVWDRYRHGGPEMRYRLLVEPALPAFEALVDRHSCVLKPGEKQDLKITLKRLHEHSAPVVATVEGLPKGVTLKQPESYPEKDGDFTLVLEAAEDSPAFSGPIAIRVSDAPPAPSEDESEPTAAEEPAGADPPPPFETLARHSFRDDNYRGPYLIDDVADIWLTVPPQEEPETEKEEAKAEENEEA